jgi:23S rRNA (cytosine1962-C5)-methyltransferase
MSAMMCRCGNWKDYRSKKDFYRLRFDTNIIINENGLKFHVDIENGQKTGYFLDQQDNRRAISIL